MSKLCSLLLPALLSWSAIGCGGGDDVKPAVAKCLTLSSAICSKYVGCGITPQSMSECMNDVSGIIKCDKAIDVSAKYDQCLATVNAGTCAQARTPLPTSCTGVIKTN